MAKVFHMQVKKTFKLSLFSRNCMVFNLQTICCLEEGRKMMAVIIFLGLADHHS